MFLCHQFQSVCFSIFIYFMTFSFFVQYLPSYLYDIMEQSVEKTAWTVSLIIVISNFTFLRLNYNSLEKTFKIEEMFNFRSILPDLYFWRKNAITLKISYTYFQIVHLILKIFISRIFEKNPLLTNIYSIKFLQFSSFAGSAVIMITLFVTKWELFLKYNTMHVQLYFFADSILTFNWSYTLPFLHSFL